MALISGSSLQPTTTAAAAQSKSWTLLNTYEAANSSIVEITDFSTEYDDYIIYIDRISSTSNGARLRMRANDIISNYSYSINAASGSSYNGIFSGGDSSWSIGSITTNTPESNNYNYSSYILQFNDINAGNTKPHFISQGTALYSNSTYIASGSGHLKEPITTIQKIGIYPDSGTLTTGKFRVYGIKG